MPIPSNGIFSIIGWVTLAVLFAYAGGRVHQWYRHSLDRDRAFREGYDEAYQALFPAAAESRPRTD